MGREGTGVELREKSIRVNFTLDGKWQRVRLPLPPTPANERYAEKLVDRVRKAVARGTFEWADYFPDSPQAKKTKPAHSFGEWCDRWLMTKGRLAKNTLAQYTNALEIWKELLGKDKEVEKLTHATVAAAVGSQPWKSAKLLNNYLIPLRGVFALAGRELDFQKSPMEGIENSQHQPPPPDPLSLSEMDDILSYIRQNYDPRVHAYFAFAFATGLRPEEMIVLRWGDVDWNNQTIRVERARTKNEVKALKTYNARDVDLVQLAREALLAMKPWTQLGASSTDDEQMGRYIFQNPWTDRPWNDARSQRDNSWNPTLRRLGIRYRRAYQTRHTYAATALMAGANPAYIARQMGHKNAMMVFKVYAKWIDGADRGRERAKIEAALKKENPAQGRVISQKSPI